MRWIQFSLTEKIARSFNYVTSSKQLWEELNERYNQTNAPHLYKLRKEMTQISQGNDTVAEYYARLKSVWEDLRSIDPLPDCTCAAIATCTCQLLKRIVERDNRNNLIDFLMGLDKKYDQIRGHILALEPLPTVNQAFAKVHQSEMQKQITEADTKVDLDGVAMAATQNFPASSHTAPSSNGFPSNNSQTAGAQDAGNVWRRDGKKQKVVYFCERCQKYGHTLAFCWFGTQGRGRGRGRFSGPPHTSTAGRGYGRGYAANVEVEEAEYEDDTPCEVPATHQNSNEDTPDPAFVQAVAKALFKMQNQNATDSPAANFAGPFH
ncbi:uncharacterized protein LOC141611005 [Silene latifolia]|uniref:uncharacterized protein LOC141611005 n=1 Tax=Silene latifolia TaxID=37657 RepID=UPI003D76B6AC